MTMYLVDSLSQNNVDGLLIMLQFGAKRKPFPAICVKVVNQTAAKVMSDEVAEYIIRDDKDDSESLGQEESNDDDISDTTSLYMCLGVDNVWYLVSCGCITGVSSNMTTGELFSCLPQEGDWEPLQSVHGRQGEGMVAFAAVPS